MTGLGRPSGKAAGGPPRPPGPVVGRAGWKPALRRIPPPPCPPLPIAPSCFPAFQIQISTLPDDLVRLEVAFSRGGEREDSSGRGRARGGRRRRRGGRARPRRRVRALPSRVRGRGGRQLLPTRGSRLSGPRRTNGAARQRGPYPTRVGTGCRPSVTSPRLGGIGSTPTRAAATGASGHRPVGSSAFRRLGRIAGPAIPDAHASGASGARLQRAMPTEAGEPVSQ